MQDVGGEGEKAYMDIRRRAFAGPATQQVAIFK